MQRLLNAGAGAVHANTAGALETACANGHLAVVDVLLVMGADVHARSDAALQAACSNGHLAVVDLLLAAGADIHVDGDAPLRSASVSGYAPVVQRLLAAGADVHAEGDDALYLASAAGQLAVVDALLAAGADVRVDSDDAVRCASARGHAAVVGRLLAAGADPHAVVWEACRSAWPSLMQHVPDKLFARLPATLQPLWLRLHLRLQLRLRRLLQRARDRLDHPPTVPLGKVRPTRPELVDHLKTAGRRFAREYWTDGLPLFFPGLDLGAVPDEFATPPSLASSVPLVEQRPETTTAMHHPLRRWLPVGLTGDQRRVLREIKMPGHPDEGVAIHTLAETLGMPLATVRTAVDALTDEGHIFSTVDADHYKSTDM